jgi:hypothetical protein
MTTLTKKSYDIVINDGANVKAASVEGYVFELSTPRKKWTLGARRKGSKWTVDDLATGLSAFPQAMVFATRKAAIEYVESTPVMAALDGVMASRPHACESKAAALKALIDNGRSMSRSEYVVFVSETEKQMTEEAEAARAEEAAVEAAAEVTMSTLRELAAAWGNVLVRQRKEGACIWVVGELNGHEEELAEMGLRHGRSKHYGEGWWMKPQEA